MANKDYREGLDYSLIPETDLDAMIADDYASVSDATLDYLNDEGSSMDAFTANAGRAITSGLRGLGIYRPDEAEDLEAERKARMLQDTNPAMSILGGVVGGVAEPVSLPFFFLKPIKVAGAIATAAARGVVSGAIYGGIEPVYDEFNDSRMLNIGVGAAFGGVIGAVAGKIASKFGFNPKSPTLKDDIAKAPEEMQARMEAEMEAEIDANKVVNSPEEAPRMLGWNGKTTEAEEVNIDFGGKQSRYNPELKSMETVEMAPSTVDFSVPDFIKGKVKIANTAANGLDDIDEALWHIGGPNAQKADIALTSLAERTGLKHKELKLMAQTARKEIVKRSGSVTKDGKLDFGKQPTMIAANIRNRVDPPREIITPIQPKRINVQDGLDINERELLKKAGVFMRVNAKGSLTFHDAMNGYKFIPGNVLKERMNAVGIDLDIPQFKQKSKVEAAIKQAEPEMKAEADARMAQESPETPTSPSKAQTKATPLDDLDVAPEDIGIPKQQRSVGSAGVDPKTYLGREMMPNTSKKVAKGGITAERVLLKMLENDDPRIAVPKDGDRAVQGSGSFAGSKQRGATELRKIINEHGNIPEFILTRKGDPRGMSDAETVAMRWFHADAMANRAILLNKLKDIVSKQEGLDTPEVAKMGEDLVYYTGVDMFMRNEGSKLSRALNARRILSQTIAQGQTPQTKMMRGLFPGMSCK